MVERRVVKPLVGKAAEMCALSAAIRVVAGKQGLAQTEGRDVHLAQQCRGGPILVVAGLGAADRALGAGREQTFRGGAGEQQVVERGVMAGAECGMLGGVLHAAMIAQYG